jgi:thioredoxin 1
MTRLLAILIAAVLLLPAAGAHAQTKPKITFLELGSVGCIPCKKMVPVMESIEKKYGDQIKVIFHDVRKEKDKAEQYNINLIPTQVFLNEKGKEIHRHVGYYPEKEIDAFLKKQGLKIRS